MSKRYNIRWNDNDLNEIKRVARNFNAKVRRLEKKYEGMNVLLPDRVSANYIQELVETRGDLNRELKSLQRFTQRGSENLVNLPNSYNNRKITEWQKTDMQRRANKINRIRKQRKADLEARELNRGKHRPLNYTRGESVGMGSVDVNMLRPTNPFPKHMSKMGATLKMDHLRRESQNTYWRQRDTLLRDNFVNTLKENFNGVDISDITKYIEDMDIDKFMDTFNEHPDDFSLAYPLDTKGMNDYAEELRSNWIPQTEPKTQQKSKAKTKSNGSRKK